MPERGGAERRDADAGAADGREADSAIANARLGALRQMARGRTPLEMIGVLGPAIAMLWAGLAIGGNVIAPAAKFTTDVPREALLQVGVAQFAWVGYAEWALALVWVLGMWPRRRSRIVRMLAVPVVLLLIQKLGVLPPLHARTEAAIAGDDAGDSALHVVYAALEGLKIAVLLVIGLVGAVVHSPRRIVPSADPDA